MLLTSNKDKFHFIAERISQRKIRNQYRTLKAIEPVSSVEIEIAGKVMVNFSSNDYLGLSKHPLLKKRSIDWINKYGNGATASRLICGTFEGLEKLEKKLALLKSTEGSLILNSGFQANISLIPAMADKETLILSDAFNHNSIIQGCILARCEKIKFRHNDVNHLRHILQNKDLKNYSRILIISESVFSMDGDRCDLSALHQIAEEFNAILIIDEAHATGVLGKNGMGLATSENADIIIGTFGKGCGSFGAYIACEHQIRDYLINYCSGFVYSTALPPSVLGAIDAALDIIPGMSAERVELQEKSDFLRQSLKKIGFDTGSSSTQIIPVILGDEATTLKASRWLEANNVLAIAIRAPTVAPDQSRIRLAISCDHSWEQIKQLVELFAALPDEI